MGFDKLESDEIHFEDRCTCNCMWAVCWSCERFVCVLAGVLTAVRIKVILAFHCFTAEGML